MSHFSSSAEAKTSAGASIIDPPYQRVCGIDVSKQTLDAHLLTPEGEHVLHVDQNPAGLQKLVDACRRHQIQYAVLEATGGLQRSAHRALHQAGIAVAVVNPGRVRYFARAEGLIAKNDPIDARNIAYFALRLAPPVTPPPSDAQEQMARLSSRRGQLVQGLIAEKNREEQEFDPWCLKDIRKHITWLNRQIARIDKELDKLVSAQEELEHKARIADEFTGIGRVSAVALVVCMPELGRINRRKAAALAGLAPYDNDSGTCKGPRSIRGGRTRIRMALYMPTLTAIRYPGDIQDMYQRLLARGKRKMQALVACMRKMLIKVNARVAEALAAKEARTTKQVGQAGL